MKRTLLSGLILGSLVAGCTQLPPSAADSQAKRFEPVSDKAVIYVVRPPIDSGRPGVLWLENGMQVATLGGTYHRLEVPPGVVQLSGYIPPSPTFTLRAEPGKVYFLRYTVFGGSRSGGTTAALQPMSETSGRAMVAQGTLYP